VRTVRVQVVRLTGSTHETTRTAATTASRRLTVHLLPVAVLRMRTRLPVNAAVVVVSTATALLRAPRRPEDRLSTHAHTHPGLKTVPDLRIS